MCYYKNVQAERGTQSHEGGGDGVSSSGVSLWVLKKLQYKRLKERANGKRKRGREQEKEESIRGYGHCFFFIIRCCNPPRREKYDVFISFRGKDTRLGITSHLHAALLQKKIETYIDCKLQSGEEIGPALRQAIEKSTISVIIFSQSYASSTWCLDELVHILKCNKRDGQIVIPVFYDINPSDVRKQHGSYADAFAQLEKRFDNNIDKVHKWRDALTTAANLSGFDYSNKSG
ncbi:toll/interleukin-1 receptor-like protein [Malus domestica]|uniref:toll/interleukin-1 receptor-like protein n=1 Tax=Malus domestica TaxID=3750 RepID=UPI00397702EC